MEITVGKTSGFCMGVNLAIEKAKDVLNEYNKSVYCLGEIVHNRQVVEKLEKEKMITVEDLSEIPNNEIVIFRAHGEPESVYEEAKRKNLTVMDATCSKVKAIHIKIKRERNSNSFIIIIGKKKHPEIIGSKGFAGDNSFVIESSDDILDAYMKFEESGLEDVYVCCQTTFSKKLYEELVNEIEDNFYEANLKIDNNICDATALRQMETENLSKKFHQMIIIGGKNSSNTKELEVIAKKNCQKVFLIETICDLNVDNININEPIAIMAGASTPKESINEVVNYLEKL